MDSQARDTYLQNQILTATPQKLRLMLIDGAIRFVNLALQAWPEERITPEASNAIGRCRGIVSELLSSVRKDDTDLTRQVSGVYLFVFQRLTEAQLAHKKDGLEEVLRILEADRATWREVCERFPEAPNPDLIARMKPKEVTARGIQAIPPAPLGGLPPSNGSGGGPPSNGSGGGPPSNGSGGGLSFEA